MYTNYVDLQLAFAKEHNYELNEEDLDLLDEYYEDVKTIARTRAEQWERHNELQNSLEIHRKKIADCQIQRNQLEAIMYSVPELRSLVRPNNNINKH